MIKTSIYTVGGTVQAGGGVYINRKADDELLRLCQDGSLAYVLSSRQVGKSSLMVRTAEKLAAENFRTVIIDLTQIGVQLTPESWYLGLLTNIVDDLELDIDILDWWQERNHLGDTQRLTQFFQEILQTEVTENLVIFIDEIDSTLSLDFTDDFFAAIRYMYNARSNIPQLQRLTFVLIGVATPGDLMSDPNRTPFNIGHRVDLTDFTFEHTLPLATGLGLPENKAEQVLKWVLKWTSGHPYLTQRLFRTIADQHRSEWTEKDIDLAAASTFFGKMSEEDNNLQFVRDMLTKWAPDEQQVLMTYREIRLGKRPVPDEEQSQIKNHLKLSGVVRRDNGNLEVRNAIYEHVFDRTWLKTHWPTSWLATVPKGVKIASVFSMILLIISVSLAIYAFDLAEQNRQIAESQQIAKNDLQQALLREQQIRIQEQSARQAADSAQQQALQEEEKARQFAASEQVARIEASESRDLAEQRENEAVTAREAAEARRMEVERLRRIDIARYLTTQATVQQQLGNQELGLLLARQAYLWSQGQMTDEVYNALRVTLNASDNSHGGPLILRDHADAVRVVALSPDGLKMASGGDDGTLVVWNVKESYSAQNTTHVHKGGTRAIVFGADNRTLVSGGDDHTIRLWNLSDMNTNQNTNTVLNGHTGGVWSLAMSDDCGTLVSGGADSTLITWRIDSGDATVVIRQKLNSRIRSVVCSRDGKMIFAGCDDGTIFGYENTQNQTQKFELSLDSGIRSLALNQNASSLAIGRSDGRIEMFAIDNTSQKLLLLATLLGHAGPVNSMVFNAGSDKLVSGSSDRSVKVWDLSKPESDPVSLVEHQSWVWSVAVNPGRNVVVSGSADKSVRVWNIDTEELAETVCDAVSRNLSRAEWDKFISSDLDYMRVCPDLPNGEGVVSKVSSVSEKSN